MKVERIELVPCSSCGNKYIAFKFDRPVTTALLDVLKSNGFTEAAHFTKAGMLYADNPALIVSGPIGSDRIIRVIDENGEQLGILAPFEALKLARERGLDLVEVSANAVPPVCRIQDYGRFLYEKEKSERAAKKKQKVITVKEVKFSVTVDVHDYQTKKNKVLQFLADGDKVKASLRFRGRQMAHRDLGYNIINKLIQDVGDAAVVEFMPRMEGTILHAILAAAKKQESPKPKPAAAPSAPAAATKAAPAPAATKKKAK